MLRIIIVRIIKPYKLWQAKRRMRIVLAFIESCNTKMTKFGMQPWRIEKFWKQMTADTQEGKEYRQQTYNEMEVG